MGIVVRRRPRSEINAGEILPNIDVPDELQRLFEKTPLLRHEDPKPYWTLLRRFAQEIKPSDTIEWLWLKDIADHTWDIIRLRCIKAALLDAGRKGAVVEIFAPVGKAAGQDMKYYGAWDEARRRADQWSDPSHKKQIESRLDKLGLDADSIAAVSFSMNVDSLEAAERMLAALEFRRNSTLREIEDRRQRVGQLLRQASDKIITTLSPAPSSVEKVQAS